MNYDTGSSRTLRLAEEVRAEAARRRVTLISLARACDITYPTLRTRLNGDIPFTVTELERIASVLNMTVTDLFARTEAAA